MDNVEIENIRELHPLVSENPKVSLSLAQDFIKATAWWHTHSSGSPVRAPRHARRVYHSVHGWSIDFGANSFLIEKAIRRCCNEVNDFLTAMKKGKKTDINDLKNKIKLHIRGAVSNYDNNEYEVYYPIDGEDMMFGAQSIDINDGLQFILRKTGINHPAISTYADYQS